MAPLRVGMLSGELKPNHQFIVRLGFREGLFGTEANVERDEGHLRSQEILVSGFVSSTITDQQIWASEFSLAKGKDLIQ